MKIVRTSLFTGEEHIREIDVTKEQLDDWRSGTLIQNAMPHLSPDDREFIMTGITPEEWDKGIITDSKKDGKRPYTEHDDFKFDREK